MNAQPAKPPHDRKLGLIGTALTIARTPKYDIKAFSVVRDEIEAVLVQSGFLDGAPFSWVQISVRYGLKEDETPHYQRINKKYGALPLAIEVSTEAMLSASLEELTMIFRAAVLRALIHAGEKYQRPTDELKALARQS